MQLHPNGQVIAKVISIAECGVHFSDTLSACEACKMNKSTQQKHPKTSRPDPSSERLKLVSADLLEPVTPKTVGGYGYMAMCTDHLGGLKPVYTIDKESDTLHTLGRFIQDLAIPLGIRVQHLCSDNKGEYTSGSFQEYCKSAGIRQQFSAPYTLQQNGVSERDGRTIMDITRCLLNETNLPKTLWREIASTAVFIINRLQHASIGGDTPHYRMFGKHAVLSFSRVIGTRAYVNVEGYTPKLQPKAWEGVLVGYDSDKPTFRVYDRSPGRISCSRNVSFIEERPTVLPNRRLGGART